MAIENIINKYNVRIEDLRRLISWCNCQSESFLEAFTLPQLVKLYNAHQLCAWDFPPDRWNQKQIKAVINRGEVPDWEDINKPKKKGETQTEAIARIEREQLSHGNQK
jgi:hypothetical protein